MSRRQSQNSGRSPQKLRCQDKETYVTEANYKEIGKSGRGFAMTSRRMHNTSNLFIA
jgi:hypothetical protein